jgi:hypothetical protein
LYPWIQIAGIIGYGLLIVEMGMVPLAFVGCFIVSGFAWYWFFAREKINREYTLLHIIERITGMNKTGYMIDEELREILIERDAIEEKHFEQLLKTSEIIDLEKLLDPSKFAELIAHRLSTRLSVGEKRLYQLLKKKSDANVILHPGLAIFSHEIQGDDIFEILVVRTKKGLVVSNEIDPVHASFIVIASPNQRSFYLHSLMWIVQMAEKCDFDEAWINAKDVHDLRLILLNAWQKRDT